MTPFQVRSGVPDQRWVKAKNVGSILIPAWGAVEISTSVVSDAGHLVYSVKRPTAANLNADLVAFNGPTSIAVSGYGQVTLDCPSLSLYDDGDALTIGQSLGTQLNSFELKRHGRGFAVVGAALGTGSEVRVPVIHAHAQAFIGKLDATMSPAGSAVVSIWSGTAGSEADTTVNITAYDWLLATGQTIASGKKVIGVFINGIPYVISAECA